MTERPLLEAAGLGKHYAARGGRVAALDGVDLRIGRCDSIGLVGESGSGKTTLARIAAGLIEADRGRLLWRGAPVDGLRGEARLEFRRGVQYVFQNPMTALNPRHRVGRALEWSLRGLTALGGAARRGRLQAVAERVGLDIALLQRYPHQLSGGQAQRVCIARALLGEPRLVILDEPVSALDVSLQAQILNLLAELRAERGLAYLFISHDVAVVERLCERIVVMRNGAIVERGGRDAVLRSPRADYTRRLLAAVPTMPGADR
ncbi:MAG: ATP-binding cassette domain-containing protein [Thiohalocapsa sp.]|nr:ATP-binding cassette domain-containing protein [Thiohalocapsa sp.]